MFYCSLPQNDSPGEKFSSVSYNLAFCSLSLTPFYDKGSRDKANPNEDSHILDAELNCASRPSSGFLDCKVHEITLFYKFII